MRDGLTAVRKDKNCQNFHQDCQLLQRLYQAYYDIYDVLKDSCVSCVSEDKILPKQEDLLRFIKKRWWTMSFVSMKAS
jgi:hypothetical protein